MEENGMNDDKTVPKRYTCGADGTAIEVENEERINDALEQRLREIERRLDDIENTERNKNL